MDKILTIVIPTYNMERYIDKCLTSLIVEDNELLSHLEILVVIDGAKDKSSEIAHSYESKFPNTIRVIDKENGNYGSCVNRGLKEAIGKYIKILDADDSFNTLEFAEYLHYLLKTDADCIITDMLQIDDTGKELKRYSYELPQKQAFGLDRLISEGAVSAMWMHCVCYRVDNLRKISYTQTEGISYTDQEWICLPMSTVKTILYYPKVIYKYLVGREGQTISPEVWNKNFWMELKGLNVMMDQRENLYNDCTEEGKRYIDLRIQHRLFTCYYAFIMCFNSYEANDLMIKIDKRLKKFDNCLYENMANNCKALRAIPFVKIWRISYNPNNMLLCIGRFLNKIINYFRS